jgi:hypothetical protein
MFYVAATSLVIAQGAPSTSPVTPADPKESAAVDATYKTKCEAKSPAPLCACVIAVTNIHINDIVEKQVFYDYMMGDVDRAKAQRAMFTPEKSRLFNVALQKADTTLGDQCDKFKPKP